MRLVCAVCGCPAAGLHGRRAAQGVGRDARARASSTRKLDRGAKRPLAALVGGAPRHACSRNKGRTIAVHYRMAPNSEAAVLEGGSRPARAQMGSNYHVQGGKHDVGDQAARASARPPAIKAFMQEPPFSGQGNRCSPAMISPIKTASRRSRDQGGYFRRRRR